MTPIRLLVTPAIIVLLLACGSGAPQPGQPAPQPAAEFVNRVWRVTEPAGVAAGTLYVFLSDNTLLITPPAATAPRLGRWHSAGGGLVLIEEGFRYPADIVELGDERFVIRVHRGGASVDVGMVPARDLSPAPPTPRAPSASSPGAS
jgi:hypothetical protein